MVKVKVDYFNLPGQQPLGTPPAQPAHASPYCTIQRFIDAACPPLFNDAVLRSLLESGCWKTSST